jgi:uncharacterized protein (TIGR03032 family)
MTETNGATGEAGEAGATGEAPDATGNPVTLFSRDLVCSRGLRAWMEKERVSLAVAAGGHLFLAGGDPPLGGSSELVLDDVAAVAWSQNQLLTLDRWQLWRFVDIAPARGPAAGGPRLLLPQSGQTLGLVGASDLVVTPEGPLVASMLFSCLLRPDPRYSFRPVWMPEWVSALMPESRTGLTGVAVRDGRADVVTLAGRSDQPDGWAASLRDGLVLTTEGDELAGGLYFPRHPRWWGDRLLFLESGSGRLVVLDRDGNCETVHTVPGVAGGLTVHGDWALVGYSAPARSGVEGLEGGPPRTAGALTDGVCVVDLGTGDIAGHATFAGHAGPVQSVAVITETTGTTIAPPRGLLSQSTVVMAATESLRIP